jgi:peptidoglycan/xylan/chitin deacetylase (PgdA/CDA1 family)
MFHNSDIVADGLPPGTLCLTYDDGPGEAETSRDGPGPRTAELGAFLASQGVAATFFAVGKFAATSGAILARLLSLGHLVANHTFDHPSLPAFVARGGDVIDQLARTNLAIGPYDQGPLTFFRAPYGDWRLRGQPLSNVARVLNRSALSSSFVGPIGWDIDAGDVGFWRDGRSADDCGLAYLEAIQSAGRGIILMHDSTADIDEIRTRNQALALAQWLVPRLRRRGFRFVRLDEIPQVVSAMKVTRQLVLASHDGDYLSAPRGSTRIMMNSRAGVDASAIWGVVDLGNNHLALRSTGGRFLSAHVDGQVCADSLFIGEREIFTVESRPSGVALRTNRAAYVAPGTHQDVRLSACGVSGTFLAIDPYHPEGMTNPDFVRRSPSIQ